VGWVTLTPDCPAANPTGGDCAAGLLEADNDTVAAALVIAATDPDYTAAFLRAVRSEHGYRAWTADEQRAYVRVEAARATMSEGGSGSYLVPFVLDPSVVLTNSSITNPVRSLAKVVTTSSATWNGVKADGVTSLCRWPDRLMLRRRDVS
jgi:predicted phage gp36 major capsid-like protein